MYRHVPGAEKVTRPFHWHLPHHLLIDTVAAVVTAMLLADCAYEGDNPDDTTMAMNFGPYFDNCLEDDFGC